MDGGSVTSSVGFCRVKMKLVGGVHKAPSLTHLRIVMKEEPRD